MGLRLTADMKSIGDIFETMVGAYYTEKGFQALHEWMKRSFEPILQAAALAFDDSLCVTVYHTIVTCQCRLTGRSPVIYKLYYRPQKAKSNLDQTTSVPGTSNLANGGETVSSERERGKRRFSEPVANTYSSSPRAHTTAAPPTQSTQGNVSSSIDDKSSRIAEGSQSSHGSTPTTSLQSHDSGLEDSSSESYDSDFEDSGDLPDFWEERCLPDGTTYYVDHTTRSTSWERPRNPSTRRRQFTVADSEAAWTARLVAPLPPIPSQAEETITSRVPAVDEHTHPPVIAELLRDGYVLENTNEIDRPSSSATIPEFCEEVQADDGRMYYVDHPASVILRR